MSELVQSCFAALVPEAQRAVERQLVDTLGLWLKMIALHSPVYVLWGWVLFRSWESFWEAVVFWIKPELWSWIDDEYWDDIWAEAKLAVWFWCPIGLIALEMWLLGW